jgi:Flp pilus assembly protein TadG
VKRRGQALVEFGLVLPVMLVIFLGIVDFGRAFYAGVLAEQAARDAARLGAGAIPNNGITTDTLQNQAYTALGWPNAACSGCWNSLGLTGTPTVRIGGYQADGTQYGWADGAGDSAQALCAQSCPGGQVQVELTFAVPLYTSFLTKAIGFTSIPVRGWATVELW